MPRYFIAVICCFLCTAADQAQAARKQVLCYDMDDGTFISRPKCKAKRNEITVTAANFASLVSGTTGPQGFAGQDGTDGSSGSNGSNGADGMNGASGTNGANGVSGYEVISNTNMYIYLLLNIFRLVLMRHALVARSFSVVHVILGTTELQLWVVR